MVHPCFMVPGGGQVITRPAHSLRQETQKLPLCVTLPGRVSSLSFRIQGFFRHFSLSATPLPFSRSEALS